MTAEQGRRYRENGLVYRHVGKGGNARPQRGRHNLAANV